MAKGTKGKLTKWKSVIKRWHSITSKQLQRDRPNASSIAAAHDGDSVAGNLRAVYVGKSRRRYLISPDLMDHPLLQELIERSSAAGGGPGGRHSHTVDDVTLASCEVVLFEHLLWMLQNADPYPEIDSSVDELVDFYATC
ncbi:auxin-responsive protein SAUR78-like [Malania oleifera]|uniref:auxin-responsive protein SAUR78-like n=1 Tax=Malania oleifera TaxID=397392 RepID=UPI0025ADDE65|nr:auxin-responsive protein SAUR78-like [Malania oleifera]